MSQLDAVLARIDSDLDAALERLFALLRIKSISTDPAFAADCRACAEWHVEDLASIGFEANAHATPGHPIVVGHDRSAPGPSALFYGHYDVQPVDPLELWEHDPFEPFIETRPDGSRAIRARGASDDKGQLMTFVEACRAWQAVAGRLPIAVSILLEGEEESGGVNLPPFLQGPRRRAARRRRPDLRHQHVGPGDAGDPDHAARPVRRGDRDPRPRTATCIPASTAPPPRTRTTSSPGSSPICATPTAASRSPASTTACRSCPQRCARSGRRCTSTRRRSWARSACRCRPASEGRTVLEMTWSRPTCEVNGMGGGYQGEGFKTVIPSEASAKISFRLVFDQDPHAIRAAFRDFVRARVPADCEVEFLEHGAGSAIRFPIEAPAFAKTRDALTAEWGRDAFFIGGGGSIPVTHELKNALGMDVVLAGFALDDDRIHSPNEKYELESFRRGVRSWARILDALAS